MDLRAYRTEAIQRVNSGLTKIMMLLLLLLKSVGTTTPLHYCVLAGFGKWVRRWLRSPKAEAHIRLQWGHCGPMLGFMDAARRLARRFSEALIQLLLSLSSPSSQIALHSSLSAAAASRSDKSMLHLSRIALAWSMNRFLGRLAGRCPADNSP